MHNLHASLKKKEISSIILIIEGSNKRTKNSTNLWRNFSQIYFHLMRFNFKNENQTQFLCSFSLRKLCDAASCAMFSDFDMF